MSRIRLIGLMLLVVVSPIGFVQAQTLNESLILEDPAKLVLQARESGDIVRGAILFHQGNINCAKCHRPAAEKDRIGPDISRLKADVTELSIVESILQPSKAIRKGYETTSVLTNDGRVVSGIVVSQNDQQVVLRGGKTADQLITILVAEIDEMALSSKSTMPDGLVNELKDRQQFLDLLRYVIDIKERGPVAHASTGRQLARRELTAELNGLVLIEKLNCVACHTSTADNAMSPSRAPNLKWSAKWLNPARLAEFISDPQQAKPGTTMPHMLSHLSAADRKESTEAIVQYLVSMNGNQYHDHVGAEPGVVGRGFELFHSVGCVACHSPRNDRAIEESLDQSVPLGDLTGKYNHTGLTNFLENPHTARPAGRMPNMQLAHRESLDVAAYLLQPVADSTTTPASPWHTDATLVKKGKSLFSELNCVKCHTGIVAARNTASGITPLQLLKPDRGCLSEDQQGDWPAFSLTESDRKDIRAALERDATELTNDQQIEITLTLFNCTACHSRNNLGGVTSDRRSHFQTTNLNLGEQGRIPPTLTGAGAKLKSKWMRDVLVNHRAIRPYMKTRMPQYGEQNIAHLVDLFQSTDKLSETEFATFDDQKAMRVKGQDLTGNKGLNCVACHTYQYKSSDTMPAVDLTEMAERLKKDWFHQYMLDPQSFSPNTVMPSFWPNGKAIRPDIAGEPKLQVEAIWQYLLDGRQARAPRGVIREPLEIIVTDEARMLRRAYPGMGKRGIGVGYPGGVNLAYDAEQMRLAMIWKGKFVDPAGAWYGQGHGRVRALGKTINFPQGPELDDEESPWVVDDGRPPRHQFKGYELDEKRRPRLKYVFDSVTVQDFHTESTDKATGQLLLSRRILMTSSEKRAGLRFRLATGMDMSRVGDLTYSVDKQLTVRVMSGHDTVVIDEADGKILYVPLLFAEGEVQELVIEYMWE